MPQEQSPLKGKHISLKKLGEVMECLSKYNRTVWINMCKGSKVRLLEGEVYMGPFPNWKAYGILCEMLVFEQEGEYRRRRAEDRLKQPGPSVLFMLPNRLHI
jgi:hypothetical protein